MFYAFLFFPSFLRQQCLSGRMESRSARKLKPKSPVGNPGVPHRIQIFSGGCGLCRQAAEMVEVGKCKDCVTEIFDVGDLRNTKLMRQYAINAVPSIVIDGRIKVTGVPDFPWFCGEEFYQMLERRYPLER